MNYPDRIMIENGQEEDDEKKQQNNIDNSSSYSSFADISEVNDSVLNVPFIVFDGTNTPTPDDNEIILKLSHKDELIKNNNPFLQDVENYMTMIDNKNPFLLNNEEDEHESIIIPDEHKDPQVSKQPSITVTNFEDNDSNISSESEENDYVDLPLPMSHSNNSSSTLLPLIIEDSVDEYDLPLPMSEVNILPPPTSEVNVLSSPTSIANILPPPTSEVNILQPQQIIENKEDVTNKSLEIVPSSTVATVAIPQQPRTYNTMIQNAIDFSGLSSADRLREMDSYKVKFSILAKAWPNLNIKCPENKTLEEVHEVYGVYLKHISVCSEADSYKKYLVVGWLIMEVVASKMGYDIEGYAKLQMKSIGKYDQMLIELGEVSYNKNQNQIMGRNSWSPETKLLYVSVMNALFFFVIKAISNFIGYDAEAIMESVQHFLNGAKTGAEDGETAGGNNGGLDKLIGLATTFLPGLIGSVGKKGKKPTTKEIEANTNKNTVDDFRLPFEE